MCPLLRQITANALSIDMPAKGCSNVQCCKQAEKCIHTVIKNCIDFEALTSAKLILQLDSAVPGQILRRVLLQISPAEPTLCKSCKR